MERMEEARVNGNSVFFRGSSIPLSNDFAVRVFLLISNQMGPKPSRFRSRMVANENEDVIGSTGNKVSTNSKRVEIRVPQTNKFTGSTENGLEEKSRRSQTNQKFQTNCKNINIQVIILYCEYERIYRNADMHNIRIRP